MALTTSIQEAPLVDIKRNAVQNKDEKPQTRLSRQHQTEDVDPRHQKNDPNISFLLAAVFG